MFNVFVLLMMCVHSTLSSTPILSALSVFDDNVELRIGKVKKMKDPLFVQDQEVEARIDNGYPNVMRNGKNRWQMWYGTCLEPNSCAEQYLLRELHGRTHMGETRIEHFRVQRLEEK